MWEKISGRVKTVFNFGIERSEWLKENKTARFIAEIPFLAGCDKAEETALSHLAIYLLALDDSTKEVFFHNPEDDKDVYSRLAPIAGFKGGNQDAIDCCMALLALCMVSNYKKDIENDKKIGKYNPVGAGVWNYEEMSAGLITEINSRITEDIKQFYTVDDALKSIWDK